MINTETEMIFNSYKNSRNHDINCYVKEWKSFLSQHWSFFILLILTENFIFRRTIMRYLKKSTAEPRRCHPHLKHYGFVVIEFFYPLSRFLLWPHCCGGEALFFEGEFFTWTKVFFQDDYVGEEQSKRDKWHKSVMYGLIKDEFAAWGHKAPRDNLFVNEVFPTHAIF